MFEHANKRELNRMRFRAGLQGIKLDDKETATSKVQREGWFKDPADYEHLSQEERDELTKKMRAQHQRGWIAERSERPTDG